MAFNTKRFRDSVPAVFRPTTFDVAIIPPPALNSGAANVPPEDWFNLRFKAFSCQMPGERIDFQSNITIQGPKRDFATGRTYSPAIVSFYETKNCRKLFLEWTKLIAKRPENAGEVDWDIGFYNDSVAPSITIRHYSQDGGWVKACKLAEAYPMDVGGYELSWAGQNQVTTFQVQFNYRFFDVQEYGRTVIAPS